MTSNSLTENEEHDIPSQILKTIFGLHASVIFLDPIVMIHKSRSACGDLIGQRWSTISASTRYPRLNPL